MLACSMTTSIINTRIANDHDKITNMAMKKSKSVSANSDNAKVIQGLDLHWIQMLYPVHIFLSRHCVDNAINSQ
jgi:hypothetical protein